MEWLSTVHLAVATWLALSPLLQDVQGLKDGLKCPVRVLKGGRVRIRSKGRVAKYVCLRGTQVLGDKYSTCIRGKWDTPVPVCINSGCLAVDVPHGQVVDTYRGAFVTVHCDPGYTLVGSQSLYCNGATWNDTVPTCREIQVAAQKWCDFESEDLCGWTHDLNHDFDWRRHNFATPSGHVGTGPSFDHTLGPGLSGHYMYLEVSSPRLENDTARLFSPVFNAISDPGACFIFWYHMYGNSTGTLNVYLHKQDTLLLFSKSGDQGNQWLQAVLPLPQTSSSFQIVMEGVRGSGYEGDIAIDDVKLAEGEECSASMSVTANDESVTATEESSSSCEGRCSVAATEPSLCECTRDCIGNNTCCPDYLDKCSTSAQESTEWKEVTTVKANTFSTGSTTVREYTLSSGTGSSNKTDTFTILSNTTTSASDMFNISVTSTSSSPLNNSQTNVVTSKIDLSNKSSPALPSLNNSASTVAVTIPSHFQTTTTRVPYLNQTTPEQVTTSKQTVTTAAFNKTYSVSVVPTFTTLTTTTQTVPPTKITTPPTKTSTKQTFRFEWNRQRFTTTKIQKLPLRPKIEFLPPLPPVIFRRPSKTNWTSSKPVKNESVVYTPTTFTTQYPNKIFNKTKKVPKSKNDVLHPVWSKDSPTTPTLPPLGPHPGTLTNKTANPGTTHTLTTKLPTTLMKLTELHQRNLSQKTTETKWKSKYKPGDEAPVHAEFARPSAPSGNFLHLVVLVSGVLLTLVTTLAVICTLRRRKINRRRMEDDELDIQFLASDEILDFTLARPSIEDIQMSETRRRV